MVPLHLNAQHPVEFAQVCHFKVLLQALDKLIDDAAGVSGDCTIIHMDSHYKGNVLISLLVEHSLVNFALLEPKLCKDQFELLVPAPSCLFKAIQCSL